MESWMNNVLRAFAVIGAMAITTTTGHAQSLGNNSDAVQELNDQASLDSQNQGAAGLAGRGDQPSPLDPLDAPSAGNVWKPSNRDAGNLSEERWAAYAAAKQRVGAAPAQPAERLTQR